MGETTIRRIVRTPKGPIAQHIHDQTRAIPRFRRSSSTPRSQKCHHDIWGHRTVPVCKAVIRVRKVEAVLTVFNKLFTKRACSSVGVAVRCGDGSGGGDESGDSLV